MKDKNKPYDAPVCDLKSQFCTGEDIRRVQRIWREKGVMIRGSHYRWCKGCRELMNGGYRLAR